jgi:hypothetical protein
MISVYRDTPLNEEPRLCADVVLPQRRNPLGWKDHHTMTTTKDIETLISDQDLPVELLHLSTSTHQSEEPYVAGMLSGMVVARQHDEVICPLMLRRNLVIPAHQGWMAQSAWRVE